MLVDPGCKLWRYKLACFSQAWQIRYTKKHTTLVKIHKCGREHYSLTRLFFTDIISQWEAVIVIPRWKLPINDYTVLIRKRITRFISKPIRNRIVKCCFVNPIKLILYVFVSKSDPVLLKRKYGCYEHISAQTSIYCLHIEAKWKEEIVTKKKAK